MLNNLYIYVYISYVKDYYLLNIFKTVSSRKQKPNMIQKVNQMEKMLKSLARF